MLQKKGPAAPAHLLLFYLAALPPHKGGRAVATAHKKQNYGFYADFNLFFASDGLFRLLSEFGSVLEMLCWKLQHGLIAWSSDGRCVARGSHLACLKNLLPGLRLLQ